MSECERVLSASLFNSTYNYMTFTSWHTVWEEVAHLIHVSFHATVVFKPQEYLVVHMYCSIYQEKQLKMWKEKKGF